MLKVQKAALVIGGTSLGLGALLLWLYWDELRAGDGSGATLFGEPGDREAPDDQGDQSPETPGTSDPELELGPALDQGDELEGGPSGLLEVSGPGVRESTAAERAMYGDARPSPTQPSEVVIVLQLSDLEKGLLPPEKVGDIIARDYRDIFGDVPSPAVDVATDADGYVVTLTFPIQLTQTTASIREAMERTNPTLAERVQLIAIH